MLQSDAKIRESLAVLDFVGAPKKQKNKQSNQISKNLIKMFTVCITEGYFAYGEDTHTLCLTSELVDLRVGYAKWIRRTEFAEPHLRSSVNMMHAVASYLWRVIEVVITRRS